MTSDHTTKITVETTIHASVDRVWKYWTTPADIMLWNNASPDWHTPHAENDLRVGGSFVSRMEAKDGSFGFDFAGIYDDVKEKELIAYTMDDGRQVTVTFESQGPETRVIETFDAENTNSHEMQRGGWQAILDNFKTYVESMNG